MQIRYKITNTTVRPPKINQNGKDMRTAIERVGHAVSFRDEKDRTVILTAGRHRFVENIDGGLLGLQRGGYIKIEEVQDMATALKDHTVDEKAEPVKKKQTSTKKKTSKEASTKRKAIAVEMGQDDHAGNSEQAEPNSTEYHGAHNPDGEPNFRVIAKKKTKRTRKSKAQRNTDEAAAAGELSYEG